MKYYELYILKDLNCVEDGGLVTIAFEKEYIRTYDILEEAIDVAKGKGYHECTDGSIIENAAWHSDLRTIHVRSYDLDMEAVIEEYEI